MPGILVMGAMADGELIGASLEAVTAGRQLADAMRTEVFGGLVGAGCERGVGTFSESGLTELFTADHQRHMPYAAEFYVAAAEALVRRCQPDLILAPHTGETSEWLPLLAGRLKAVMASNCTRIELEDQHMVVTRPVCGGAVQGEYIFNGSLRIATLEPAAYPPAERGAPCPVSPIELPDVDSRVTVLEELVSGQSAGPKLKNARVVVSGGLGIGGRENWTLIEDAAAALGAATGATRAVVDLGWVPHSLQVGFSGQKISPELYIAVGISGAVHHMAGLAGAKSIVAINTDAEAVIFSAAQFGVVGDAKKIIPAFIARLKELRAEKD